MGSVTLLQLEQNVLNLLNETFDSPAADLRAGAAGGATIVGSTKSFPITGATNAAPIVITASTAHGYADGNQVTIVGVGGNTAANGTFYVKVTGYSSTTFALFSDAMLSAAVAGNAAYTSGGTSSSTSTMKTLLNEAAADLARSCFPVPDMGTLSWTSGVRTQSIASFAPATTGNVLWAVRGASFAGQPVGLKWCERSALERSDPNWMVTSTAAPNYWYNDGPFNIGIYPKPSTTGTVTVDGFAVPAPMAASTDTLSWLPDDLSHLLVWYVADMIARKNMEDQALSARSDDWREWRFLYDTARQDLWSKIPASMRYLFPTPPITARPMPPMMGGGSPSMGGSGGPDQS